MAIGDCQQSPAHHRMLLTVEVSVDGLQIGDVLLLSGTSVFARLVRLIEDTSFDHVAMVVPANLDDSKFGRGSNDDRTAEPWMADVGFFGGRVLPLSAYDDELLAVAVRRHRLPVGDSPERAVAIANATGGYAWDRLLFLALIGATRWSAKLGELSDRECSAMVRALYEVLAQMSRAQHANVERRICTEILTDAFDVHNESLPDAPHLGLAIQPVAHEGLLWWASGIESFGEFLRNQPPPRRRGILDRDLDLAPGSNEALALVHELSVRSGLSFAGFVSTNDNELRTIVIDGVRITLDALANGPLRVGAPAVSDPRRLAWFLLDQLMRRRMIVTPADLASTPTLRDVGFLDLGQLH